LTPIQIAGLKSVANPIAGTARAFISVQNISSLPSTGKITVTLILLSKNTTQELEPIEAGRIKETDMNLAGLDPLELIKGIPARIQVTLNNRFMSDGQLLFASADPKLELTIYFDQLIKGQGRVPESIRLEDRILEVKKMISDKNLAEVSGDIKGTPWKNDKPASMLGFLVQNLRSVDQTSATKKIYAQLGQDLWEHRKKLGKVLFFKSGNRKEYESLCKELMQ
jgi:hypothetical protein